MSRSEADRTKYDVICEPYSSDFSDAGFELISITVVRRNDKQVRGFVVLPKRWVVERRLGWINRADVSSKTSRRQPTPPLALLLMALAFMLTQRLAGLPDQSLTRIQSAPISNCTGPQSQI